VYEQKLVCYLLGRVLPRGNTKKGKIIEGQPMPAAKPLSRGSIDKWVAAVISLYDEQKALGQNSHPHPRGVAVKAILRKITQEEHQNKRDAHEDRATGTLLDGYDANDFKKIETFWANSQERDGEIEHHLKLRGLTLTYLESFFTRNA